jgi:hypothetical protein
LEILTLLPLQEPLLVKHYIIEGCQLLSWGFSCFIILYHWCILLIFGIFFTMAAFGDFMIIHASKKKKNSLVLDHPSEVTVISTENMKFKYLNFKLFDHI